MNEKDKSIVKQISVLSRKSKSYVKYKLGSCEMSPAQHLILRSLYKKDGVSQEELSKKLEFDKGTIARAIKKLEAEGYLIRKVDEKDKRAYKVYLTTKSEEIKRIIDKAFYDFNEIISRGFTQEEMNLFNEFLNRAIINISEYKNNCCSKHNEI
ncbi:MarR family winged helix-turn-helix transcriptional regulator [Tepidibacter formicigenes]|jgi:DNA-binding MarR family transcriptional regulator|uniref:DNA-binding transcriptional regulator, MarR family n=1 Tax=Tepidibacter formicigenes DSM 15518 TaxID=1123349 RepID=A0A1M6JE63_9FIRM|nr:MarR family transcriptional regulator [Tepidibacter formicigenes]SHJ45019.1 DNA-binding transcriptional regulator, MarR family [Tepidibacter formicigenes DSM 15518]